MADRRAGAGGTRSRVLLAFAAVYVVWGSTYLAIRFAIDTIPPFLMAGTRFLIAGAILFAWGRQRGAARPSRVQWRTTAIVGALLLVGGNGGVVWAEQRVPSGVAALLVAVVPLWMVLIEWLRPGGRRPRPAVMGGVAIGLAGMVVLVGPRAIIGHGNVDALGALVLIAAALSWATGSLYSRHAPMPSDPLVATGMEMLAGGALLILAGIAAGEPSRLHLDSVSLRSLLALLYLITFGAIVGFTAYTYMLKMSTPAKVSTYAYVNPVVAVLLGWMFAAEPVTPRMLVASAIIVAAVALITLGQSSPRQTDARAADPESRAA
ncbi:MAG: drug/metabolite exporter YedA [Gemmatimonadaceae bacterium]